MMRRIAFALLLMVPGTGIAQSHFTFTPKTGASATVLIPASVQADIGGHTLAAGDEIGLFSPDGLCVGAAVWNDENSAITVWGDDITTEDVDGLQSGDQIMFKVWRAEEEKVYDNVDVTYSVGDGVYYTNAIFAVESIEAGVLPVELNGFTGVVRDREIVLKWKTASESNNAGFEIQRQTAGHFAKVAFVEGKGSSTTESSYRHRIENAEPGRHVFRLKQVDLDGTFSYSSTVEVVIELDKPFMLSAPYPNPANPQVSFTLVAARDQYLRVEVLDMLGRRLDVLHDGSVTANDPYRFSYETGHLSSGVYIYEAVSEGFRESRRFTVLR